MGVRAWVYVCGHVLCCALRADGCTAMQPQFGKTALDVARSRGEDDVVKLLEEAAEKKKSAKAASSNLAPPLSAAAPANISPTVAQGDPDEPRDRVSLHASTCATKRQTGG